MGLKAALTGASLLALSGCTAVIDQETFFPAMQSPPAATLTPPPDYRLTERLFELPNLGRVHAVLLDNPASETTVIYHGGNGSFVSAESVRAAALAAASNADLILYDYPGRGGTTVPATIDAALATGPALLAALREAGWIGGGPLFGYGLSFGGSQAAAMARDGGFAGLILEGTAADIATVGRNFVPPLAKPFVRLRVDPALSRFDYLGYAAASGTPVLLIATEKDEIVRVRNMRAFEQQLRARGTPVQLVVTPGTHGEALRFEAGQAAVKAFIERQSRR